MSQLLINKYLSKLAELRRVTGASRESQVRNAFQRLLEAWGESKKLTFVAEYDYEAPGRVLCRVDGALVESLRRPFGWWEAKDTADDLDEEIVKKLRRGYPQTNIIFEDGRTAVLIQDRVEQLRTRNDDTEGLARLLTLFFDYAPEENRRFRKAVDQFKSDLPAVLAELRKRIEAAYKDNAEFVAGARAFLAHAKETINPAITDADVREMLIQHILTEDIFARVFNEGDFHRENNVAKALYGLEHLFFRGQVKKETLAALEPYYAEINSTAVQIGSHQEKQRFLKAIYENFYKVYNAKAADRLGVVYTPNEIVRFMIESADWLCERHFGRNLIDRDVEILDPATGTGTFIVELLNYFQGQLDKLRHKYKEELHANEVAILPYYVANLNIEATYAAITGQYAEFPNLCFVDTLDNVAALGNYAGHQPDLLGAVSDENVERVRRQNRRKISVIIGNPPYNAWQENFNDRNANRPYKRVDERIKETYVKEGTAQNQISVYDMYTRFFRWASDRVPEDGIVAFITGRKPLSKTAYDGFRKVIARDFAEVWIMDLGGDVRDNVKLSGTKHNVFGIQIGVAIWFLVRRKGGADPAIIRYARRPEAETAADKLSFLSGHSLRDLPVEMLQPDKRSAWIEQAGSEWESLPALVSRDAKAGASGANAICSFYTRGVATQRDEWVYDESADALAIKAKALIDGYEQARDGSNPETTVAIKWDRELEAYKAKGITLAFDHRKIIEADYRPFVTRPLYFDRHLNGMVYRVAEAFGADGRLRTPAIALMGDSSGKPYFSLAIDRLPDLNFVSPASGGTQTIPRYQYVGGERVDNISDWALKQFTAHYSSKVAITKDDIFHYVYAVLHDPVYRET